jgi:hypothetical protein
LCLSTRQVGVRHKLEEEEKRYNESSQQIGIRRIMIKSCPTMNIYCNNRPEVLTLDCDAEADLMRHNVAISLGLKIMLSVHDTTQADSKSPLKSQR